MTKGRGVNLATSSSPLQSDCYVYGPARTLGTLTTDSSLLIPGTILNFAQFAHT